VWYFNADGGPVNPAGPNLVVIGDYGELVRMVLMPAFMHVLGRWNWSAPKTLVRLHDRIGLHEDDKLTERTPMPAVLRGSGLHHAEW
jgi:hypothetical protein